MKNKESNSICGPGDMSTFKRYNMAYPSDSYSPLHKKYIINHHSPKKWLLLIPGID